MRLRVHVASASRAWMRKYNCASFEWRFYLVFVFVVHYMFVDAVYVAHMQDTQKMPKSAREREPGNIIVCRLSRVSVLHSPPPTFYLRTFV